MWFPRRQILVEVYLQYNVAVLDSDAKAHCKSGFIPKIKTSVDGDIKKIEIEVEAPEVFIIDPIVNTGSCNVIKILVDGIEINQNLYNKVFKVATNRKNLPVNSNNIDFFQPKFGNNLTTNSYIIFDIYEKDFITYLLSIGNKMIF